MEKAGDGAGRGLFEGSLVLPLSPAPPPSLSPLCSLLSLTRDGRSVRSLWGSRRERNGPSILRSQAG